MPSKFKIQISNPCHEEWEGMQADLNGRFCSSCQKTVVDFTCFSDTELKDWFDQNRGNSCGRFKPGQLDRYIGKEKHSYFKLFKPGLIAASLFAFLNFPKPVFAQGAPRIEAHKSANKQAADHKGDAYTFIKGKVSDQNGNGLNHIKIELKQQNVKVQSAADGSFYIKIGKPKNKTINELIFTSAAFETKNYYFVIGEEQEISIVLQPWKPVNNVEQPVSSEIAALLSGTLGGISIKSTFTRKITSGFMRIFK